MNIKHLDHLNLSVRNFDEAATWYQRVFGFAIVEKGLYVHRPWGVLRSGEAMLCLYENPDRVFWDGDKLKAEHVHGINHFALRITDRTTWEVAIAREALKVDYGGAWKWPHSTAWYVNDPTGYTIEVVLWDDEMISF